MVASPSLLGTGLPSSALVPRALVLYDGLCGFCDDRVRWVARRDHGDRFRFAPQQSLLAEEVLSRHGFDRAAMLATNSVYLLTDFRPGQVSSQERLLTSSDVMIEILVTLGGAWKGMGRLLSLVPRFLRDGGYRLFARNRFRFSRRLDSCSIPSTAEREKFLT